MSIEKGFFITLEGFEGSGKTTIARKLYDLLQKNGLKVILTKEPGGTPIADKIRGILLERENVDLGYKAELLLFAASRSENIRINIRPALEKGFIVISDRYFDSTTVYQGYGRGINMEIIDYLNHFAVDDMIPNITFFLDVDSKTGLMRSTNFNQGREMRFEDEFMGKKQIDGKLFLDRVKYGYHQIATKESQRIKMIDANRSISLVLDDIIKLLNERLSPMIHREIRQAND